MHVALDATPLLGTPTGVGRYVAGLVVGLAALPDPPTLTLAAFTWRGASDVPALPGTRVAGRRAPARLLQTSWLYSRFPPVEWLTGRVDVMHGTNFVLPPRRRAAGVLTIHDLTYLHDPDTVTPAVLRYRRLVPRALANGAVVVTPSRATADDVQASYRLDPTRLCVTPLGVDAAWFDTPAADAGWLAEHGLPDRYVLAVGNLEPRKNLSLLVAAHARLIADEPDTPPLVLVGPPGWGPPLAAGPGVVFAGYRHGDELRRIVASASLLAFPSRREGFGLPPLEALAAGVPVVAGDLPVTREVLGDAARLVNVAGSDAVDAWASALHDTLTTPPSDDAAAARRAHARRFTWRRCAEATVRAYQLAAEAGR